MTAWVFAQVRVTIQVTLSSAGLTAFGLREFVLETNSGSDVLNVSSDALTPPAAGTYRQSGTIIEQTMGGFSFDGGTEGDTLNASADLDWQLSSSHLNDQLRLLRVEQANLEGGVSGNEILVTGWAGAVDVDAGNGVDQVTVHAADGRRCHSAGRCDRSGGYPHGNRYIRYR